jgi:hypothetical protein
MTVAAIAEKSEYLTEDIVFALDCSRSMLAADVAPNRLERAKLAVQDFVRRYPNGRVGLVAAKREAERRRGREREKKRAAERGRKRIRKWAVRDGMAEGPG